MIDDNDELNKLRKRVCEVEAHAKRKQYRREEEQRRCEAASS